MNKALVFAFRLTAFCTHGCNNCFQADHHCLGVLDSVLNLEAMRTFCEKARGWAFSHGYDEIRAGLTATGDPVFAPDLRGPVEICRDILGASTISIQTSGPDSEAETDKLATVLDLAREFQERSRLDRPSFAILTSIFNEPRVLSRFKRLITLGFPYYQVNLAHTPTDDWSRTLKERDLFLATIKGEGYRLSKQFVRQEAQNCDSRQKRMGIVHELVKGRSKIATNPGYVFPMGAAHKDGARFVWERIKDPEPALTKLTILEDGSFTPCDFCHQGLFNIADPELDLGLVITLMDVIRDESHSVVKAFPEYHSKLIYKCHVCPLTDNRNLGETYQLPGYSKK